MEKSNINFIRNYFYYICVFVFICSSFSLLADDDYQCEFCGFDVNLEDQINYEELGDYHDIYRTFESMMEKEECEGYSLNCGVFSKWDKNLKRWLKKRTVRLIKKMVDLEKIRNAEDCAYTVANFKRKIDDVHDSGNIEDLLDKFEDQIFDDSCYASIEKFKDRIRFYHYNNKAKPPKDSNLERYNLCIECSHNSKNHKTRELDNIPTRALIGGVEIACGSLIMVLPFPGCKWLGCTLVTHGTTQIYEGYMHKYETEERHPEGV